MARPERIGYMKAQRDLNLELAVAYNWQPMRYCKELMDRGFLKEDALKEADYYIDNRQKLKYNHRMGKVKRTVEESGYKPEVLASKLKPTGLTKSGVKMWIKKYKKKKREHILEKAVEEHWDWSEFRNSVKAMGNLGLTDAGIEILLQRCIKKRCTCGPHWKGVWELAKHGRV